MDHTVTLCDIQYVAYHMRHMVCNIPYISPKKLTIFELRFNNLDFTCKTYVEQGIQVSYKFFCVAKFCYNFDSRHSMKSQIQKFTGNN